MIRSLPALDGLRVVEIGQMISGPFCGHLFADHGAEVIKVEPPETGDVMRTWGLRYRGLGLYWPIISRGKKSVTLDLREPRDQDRLRRLAATADVVVENFRPGTLERWGLGPDVLHAHNPRLVIVRISGYGQDGPYRDRAGFGSVAEAMSGFRHLTAEPGHQPVRVGVSLGDALAGTQGFIGALLALLTASRRGSGGQVVDVGLYESMWMYMEGLLPEFDKLGEVRQPTGATLPGIAPSNVYPTRDHSLVVIGGNNDAVFARLAALMGRPEWVADGGPYRSSAGRGAAQLELDIAISDWTAGQPAGELLEQLHAAGVPAGSVYTAVDIAGDPHYLARDMIVSVPEPNLDGETVRGPGIVPKLSVTPGRAVRGGPLLGEHNGEILAPLDDDPGAVSSQRAAQAR